MVEFDLEKRTLSCNVPDDVLETRMSGWTPPAPRYERGVMGKYARLVSSAAEGAITN